MTEQQPKTEAIALVDLDGTLADFDSAMEQRLSVLRSPDEPSHPPEAGWKNLPDWLEARRALVKSSPGFWTSLPRITDGFAVLEKIQQAGFETHILTKGPFSSPNAWTEKVSWARVHAPDIPVTITEDKGLIYGRVLFDDWPPYIERWLEWRPRGLVVMLDQPWNQGFDHPNVFRYKQIRRSYEPALVAWKNKLGPRPEALAAVMNTQDHELWIRLIAAKSR